MPFPVWKVRSGTVRISRENADKYFVLLYFHFYNKIKETGNLSKLDSESARFLCKR